MKTRHILSILIAIAAITLTSCATSSGSAGGVKPYPLKTCIVTGNELGSMGDPITEVYQGQQVKFCCKACIAKFHKDPAKYLAKLGG
jgi:YHS domain-containing protein